MALAKLINCPECGGTTYDDVRVCPSCETVLRDDPKTVDSGAVDFMGKSELDDVPLPMTTTPTLPGVADYVTVAIVGGSSALNMHAGQDFLADVSNFVGLSSGSSENKLEIARDRALLEMKRRALKHGANGVLGVSFDNQFANDTKHRAVVVTATGTAIRFSGKSA